MVIKLSLNSAFTTTKSNSSLGEIMQNTKSDKNVSVFNASVNKVSDLPNDVLVGYTLDSTGSPRDKSCYTANTRRKKKPARKPASLKVSRSKGHKNTKGVFKSGSGKKSNVDNKEWFDPNKSGRIKKTKTKIKKNIR